MPSTRVEAVRKAALEQEQERRRMLQLRLEKAACKRVAAASKQVVASDAAQLKAEQREAAEAAKRERAEKKERDAEQRRLEVQAELEAKRLRAAEKLKDQQQREELRLEELRLKAEQREAAEAAKRERAEKKERDAEQRRLEVQAELDAKRLRAAEKLKDQQLRLAAQLLADQRKRDAEWSKVRAGQWKLALKALKDAHVRRPPSAFEVPTSLEVPPTLAMLREATTHVDGAYQASYAPLLANPPSPAALMFALHARAVLHDTWRRALGNAATAAKVAKTLVDEASQVLYAHMLGPQQRMALLHGAVQPPLVRKPSFIDLFTAAAPPTDVRFAFHWLWRAMVEMFVAANARPDAVTAPTGLAPAFDEDDRGVSAYIGAAGVRRVRRQCKGDAPALAMLSRLVLPKGEVLPPSDSAAAYLEARSRFGGLCSLVPKAITAVMLAQSVLQSRLTVGHLVLYKNGAFHLAATAARLDAGVRAAFRDVLTTECVATSEGAAKRAATSASSQGATKRTAGIRAAPVLTPVWAEYTVDEAMQLEAEMAALQVEEEAVALAEAEAMAAELQADAAADAAVVAAMEEDAARVEGLTDAFEAEAAMAAADGPEAAEEALMDECPSDEEEFDDARGEEPEVERWAVVMDMLLTYIFNTAAKELRLRVASILRSDKADSSLALRTKLKAAQVKSATKEHGRADDDDIGDE